MRKFLIQVMGLFVIATCESYSVKEMNLKEKVGQLLIVHFNGEMANEEAKTLIQNTYVGGFIYYNWANGLHSPQQVRALSSGLQKLTENNRIPIPLLIAVDQEGGRVSRLHKGFTVFPSNHTLALTGDTNLSKLSAIAIAQELTAVGINMNFAPVVDVNSNPKNPVIGTRSYGKTADIVIPFARKAIEGFHKGKIITTLKHFPGHGDVEIDSHQDLPIIKKSLYELKEVDMLPFAELAQETDAMMTAHIIVHALDKENCTTLSKSSMDYLRNVIGFKGIIISDSLVMEGLLKNCLSVEDAALKALMAGCDMLILGGKQLIGPQQNLELNIADVQRIHAAIVDAFKTGLLSEDRINQSVQKILALKQKYNIGDWQSKSLQIDLDAHHALADKITFIAEKNKETISLTIPAERVKELGDKIWKNECNSSTKGLTHWNVGENFGSFGIGHFIWYPTDTKKTFQETFPDLLIFLQKHGATLPEWLTKNQGCPWKDREEFSKFIDSTQMVGLRKILYDTRDLQALFIIQRLKKALSEITSAFNSKDKEKVLSVFSLLVEDPKGLYAVVDYSNFKGMGSLSTETYNGQGWGLFHVLSKLNPTSDHLLLDFVTSAKAVLLQRIQNSPSDKNEKQWQKGWLNRIDTYLNGGS